MLREKPRVTAFGSHAVISAAKECVELLQTFTRVHYALEPAVTITRNHDGSFDVSVGSRIMASGIQKLEDIALGADPNIAAAIVRVFKLNGQVGYLTQRIDEIVRPFFPDFFIVVER